MPTAGPESYLEVFGGLLQRRSLAVAHSGGKNTDNRGLRKTLLPLFALGFLVFVLFYFLSFCSVLAVLCFFDDFLLRFSLKSLIYF